MSAHQTTEPTHWRTTVAVRVPGTDGGNLADGASRRLARGEGIAVDDVALQAIEPGLAATNVRVDARLRVSACLDEGDLRHRVAAAPGVQRVESVRPV